MKIIVAYCSFLLFCVSACKNEDKKEDIPEDDINTARYFIKAALEGDFDKARSYVVKDSMSQQDIDASERLYKERMKAEDKMKAMAEAGITVCASPAEIGEKIKSRVN